MEATERVARRSSVRLTVTVTFAVAIALVGMMQSFRFVEKGWCLHDDVILPRIDNKTLTRKPVLNNSVAASAETSLPSAQTRMNQSSSFALTVNPRDHVLPYEQVRLDVSALSGNRIIHVLSHSHWDREWYLSLEQFRGSLVTELDRVFTMLNDSSYNFHHFHMDGQFLMVEDYLEVRPQMTRTVAEMNAKGKISLGPFYSQPDVFLSSGEALIRNLMLGMSLSSDMGGTSTVGYLADTFGFIGQLPQVLRGVGIHSFVSGRFAKTGSTEGYWMAPDGSTVLFAYLGNWYCHAIDSFRTARTFTSQQAKTVLQRLDSDLTRAGAKSKHRLAMHGCDHFMTDPEVGRKLKVMNDAAGGSGLDIVQTNIDDYIKLLTVDLRGETAKLPTVKGEVREGVDMLINSASTKMSVKQQNFKLQTLLEKWIEPMEAYGWALDGRRYDSDRIWHAWKPILQTHAHDSICATSASSVIHDIVNRLKRAEESAYRLVADQAGHVVPAIIRQLQVPSNRGHVLVVNPTNTARKECFAFTVVSRARSVGNYKGFKNLLGSDVSQVSPLVLAESGRPMESFELPNKQFRQVVYKSSATYLAQIDLPPNGIALLDLVEQDAALPQEPLVVETTSVPVTLTNKFLSAIINESDGSCTLTHVESGYSWKEVNRLWRTTEAGSTYLHRAKGNSEYASDLHIVSRKTSFLFSSIRLEGKLGSSSISITYVLFANAKTLQIETCIDNSEDNNYVAASFPVRRMDVGMSEKVHVDVDGSFEYVDRSKMTNRYVHQNRFTSLYSSGASLTVANRGIPEYKVGKESMEITLLRGVNKIGDWIAGPLGDNVSQELGRMAFQYAIAPDICRVTEPLCTADLEARNFVDPIGSFSDWVVDGYRPERYIDMDVSPLSVVANLRSSITTDNERRFDEPRESAGTTQLFNLKPEKLILSSVKKAESKDALVVRVYNPTNQSLSASLSAGLVKFSRVEHVLLNENSLGDEKAMSIERGGNEEFLFTVDAYKIVTLLLFTE